jgi:DNA polymerase III delta prime subunit
VNQPWTNLYRPSRREDFVGNAAAVAEIEKWAKQWQRNKPPKKRALFLYGPPGIGKTSIAQVIAKGHDFDLIEINASDARNKSTLEEVLGKAIKQNMNLFGKRRLILLDEMDGLSGTSDRGGVSYIAKAIDESSAPMILVANTVKEHMEGKFRAILRKVKSIEFKPISTEDIVTKLDLIAGEQGVNVDPDTLFMIAMQSDGDLRSAIVDLETVSSGKETVTEDDLVVLNGRDRSALTVDILNRIFCATILREAKQTIRQSMISYDDLYDWIFENLPTVIDDPVERLAAIEMMAKADIYQSQARKNDYRLLKYMFDLMTGGVAFTREKSEGTGYRGQLDQVIMSAGLHPSKIGTSESSEGIVIKPNGWLGKDIWSKLNTSLRDVGAKWVYGRNVWVLPYYKEPQTKWRFIKTFHSRRRLKSVAQRIAHHTHISSARARTDVMPLLSYMIRNNREMYDTTSEWMTNIPESKLSYLRTGSFDKSPRDYVNIDNYAKYKQRETQKRIEEAKKQKESDLKNIQRWLDDEKKAATWK